MNEFITLMLWWKGCKLAVIITWLSVCHLFFPKHTNRRSLQEESQFSHPKSMLLRAFKTLFEMSVCPQLAPLCDWKDHAKLPLPLPIPGSRCSSGHSYQETSLPTQTHVPTQAEKFTCCRNVQAGGWETSQVLGSSRAAACWRISLLVSWTSLLKVHSSSPLGHVHLSLCASVLQLSRGDDSIN